MPPGTRNSLCTFQGCHFVVPISIIEAVAISVSFKNIHWYLEASAGALIDMAQKSAPLLETLQKSLESDQEKREELIGKIKVNKSLFQNDSIASLGFMAADSAFLSCTYWCMHRHPLTHLLFLSFLIAGHCRFRH